MKIFDLHRIFLLIILVTLCHTEEEDDNECCENVGAFNYHTRIGIPEAALLMVSEDISHVKLNVIYQIIGGQVTHVKDVPYQAGLIITLWIFLTSICGGSLISSSRILTAAHCYHDGILTSKSFEVVLGSSKLFTGGKRIYTKDVAVHPNWNPKTGTNDLAILRIPPVTFSLFIQPIALPEGEMLSNKFEGWIALASGYGITGDDKKISTSQHLSSVNLTIISNADCAAVFQEYIRNSTICTRGDDQRTTCHGDSGGPLVVTFNGKPILVGATSFGAKAGCEKGLPVAYSRISSFMDWIVYQ